MTDNAFYYLTFFSYYIYSLLVGVTSLKIEQLENAPIYELSSFDSKLKNPTSILGAYYALLALIGKVNGVIFLVMLGVKVFWWLPIVLFITGALLFSRTTIKLISNLRNSDFIFSLILIAASVMLPVLGVSLWITLYYFT